ncbi:rCG46206, isoform CRA_a [Rattus norvegicus]|uniref:RCG46206, isoform CRA_a n=1 Tax=Rattus norvegicus TaxID=10116 RepID=A6ID70_RAT|nr:rCG46206, isoform CRA_a [Rattus norvegicus]EDM09428.1 rCG46206, isoform CRA_a [Rattus norvegicus]
MRAGRRWVLRRSLRACKGRGLDGRNGRSCVLTSRRPYILDSATISAFRSCEAKLSRNGPVDLCDGTSGGISQAVLWQRWMKAKDS